MHLNRDNYPDLVPVIPSGLAISIIVKINHYYNEALKGVTSSCVSCVLP